MRQRLITKVVDFDPFSFNYFLRPFHRHRSRVLVPIFALLIAALIVVTVLEGTFGGTRDFQLVDDLYRISGATGPAPSEPTFPFIRDVASWLLLFTIVVGGVALHQQWRLMRRCLTELTQNGALIAKRSRDKLRERKDFGSKLLGIDRILDHCEPEEALAALVGRVMGRMQRWRVAWSVLCALVAIVLAALLIFGQKHGLFQTFAPRHLEGVEREQWLDAAYAGWWASDHHLGGHIMYWLLAIIALCIIVGFNSVGMIAIYVVLCLRYVVQLSADWLNRDGRYGWTPIAKIYRTMLLGVALLSLALTVTLAVLGLNNFGWISVLLVMYCVVVPTFIFVPRFVFRAAEENARNERIEDIVQEMRTRGLDLDRDFDRLDPFLTEIDRIRKARIRPFRLRRASFSTLAFVYVVPIILGILQVMFPSGLAS